MNAYTQMLEEMGIAKSRVEGINDAMKKLNSEICNLDNSGLRAFGQKFGVIGHLDEYAKATGDRNAARELYQIAIHKAVKNIDLDEFPEFSDKLFYLAEQAAELKIPGASMLCKSLIDIRNIFENDKRPMAKFAAKMKNIGFINHNMDTTLWLHNSGPYNSENSHLNDNIIVGYATHLMTYNRHCNDYNEDGTKLMFIQINTDDYNVTKAELIQSIKDTYKVDSCRHEHDCCGCTRQSVSHVKLLANDVYAVKISWRLVV